MAYVPPHLRGDAKVEPFVSKFQPKQQQQRETGYKSQPTQSSQSRNFEGFNQLKTVGGGMTASEAMIYPPPESVLFNIEKKAVYESFEGMQQERTFPKSIPSIPSAESIIDLKLNDIIMKNMNRCHYDQLTPIQACSIPIIQQKLDLLALANTGSGKTATFAIPIIQDLLEKQKVQNSSSPVAIVIVPTRELAMQTALNFYRLSYGTNIKVRVAYGGDSKRDQMMPIKQGCDVLIGTPGRLNDFLSSSIVSFSNIRYLVLDEMDRCFDEGFEVQVKSLVKEMPQQRQTLLFSATNPQSVQQFVQQYTNDLVVVKIGDSGVCRQIDQQVKIVQEQNKFNEILSLLDQYTDCKILIFAETKQKTSNIQCDLKKIGIEVEKLNGDMEQCDRTQALARFKKSARVLICTDVASRGIDLPGIGLVINYDQPKNQEDYTHRIGRTGRVGTLGVAITFMSHPYNYTLANYISNQIKQAGGEVTDDLKSVLTNMRGSDRNNSRDNKSSSGKYQKPREQTTYQKKQYTSSYNQDRNQSAPAQEAKPIQVTQSEDINWDEI